MHTSKEHYLFLKGIDIMANTKKLTLTEQYADLLTIKEIAENPVRKAFIEGRIAQLAKKNAGTNGEKKLTATQEANLLLKNAIYNAMTEGGKYTVTDIMKLVPELDGLSNQKVNALVAQMVKANVLERVEEKRRAYFVKVVTVADEEAEA